MTLASHSHPALAYWWSIIPRLKPEGRLCLKILQGRNSARHPRCERPVSKVEPVLCGQRADTLAGIGTGKRREDWVRGLFHAEGLGAAQLVGADTTNQLFATDRCSPAHIPYPRGPVFRRGDDVLSARAELGAGNRT